MFAFGTKAWDRFAVVEAPCRTDLKLSDLSKGVVAGTRVATPLDWCAIETVKPGDYILTADDGMQQVSDVQREVIWTDQSLDDPANELSATPTARNNLYVLPSSKAEAFGDPFAMIPEEALDSFRTTTRMAPAERMEVIRLQFTLTDMGSDLEYLEAA